MRFNQPDDEPPPSFPAWAWWRAHPQILYGFVGWYVVNGLLYLLPGVFNALGIFIFLGNLLAIIILPFIKRVRYIGVGMLIAIALNFAISLVMGLIFNALCFVPFFTRLPGFGI